MPAVLAEPSAADAAATFRRVFAAELGYVWRTLRRLGVQERDVEDVTHEVFIDVFRKLGAYDSRRPLRPWLFGFCFRAASEYRRAARHRVEVLTDAIDGPTTAPLAEEAISRAEEARLVQDALGAIDLDRRAVLVAYELDEIPMKDIAETLQIPLHTGYSRLRVGREEFATAVARLRLRRGER